MDRNTTFYICRRWPYCFDYKVPFFFFFILPTLTPGIPGTYATSAIPGWCRPAPAGLFRSGGEWGVSLPPRHQRGRARNTARRHLGSGVMGGDGRPQVRHPWTQLGGPEEGVIRPPPTPGAPAADGERGRDLPLPLRSLLLRNDCFAEGNHRVPGLCAADHRSDDGRQRQVTAYSRDEGTARLLPSSTLWQRMPRRVLPTVHAVVTPGVRLPVYATQVLPEAAMPREHLRRPKRQGAVPSPEPVRQYRPDGLDGDEAGWL